MSESRGGVGAGEATPDYVATALTRAYRRSGGGSAAVRAVDGIDLTIHRGQRLGIVGGSGSGKSTLVRLLMALVRPTSGSILFRGGQIAGVPERELATLRREVQMVFQDPRSSLDPRMRVGRIVAEPLRAPSIRGMAPTAVADRVREVLGQVGLEPEAAGRFPHEFSGGQRQRIAIARALAPAPSVLIADEAVSALDVSVRAQVLNVLMDRVRDDGLTLIFVSHDLAVVRHICDTVAVMHAGRIVESGSIEAVYEDPQTAYTRDLLAAIPAIRLT